MKERPILFSAPMVRAILDGRKSQTRRVVKPQPRDFNDQWYPDRYNHTEDWCFWGKKETEVHNKCGLPLFRCPYGKPGDLLWVRETWCPLTWGGYEPIERYLYVREGDCCVGYAAETVYGFGQVWDAIKPHWRPSIFMPRWASRITLEVVEVRVQRLQDISEEDAVAEGIYRNQEGRGGGWRAAEDAPTFGFAASAYRDLWESIHGEGSWAENPWVWVVSFTRNAAEER